MPLFLLLQQQNEQLLILLKMTCGDPSSLSHEFLPWSNSGQSLQGTLTLHIFLMFNKLGDELPNLTGTCNFYDYQVVETHPATWIFFHQYTNMFVVFAPPDMCVVFFDFIYAIY